MKLKVGKRPRNLGRTDIEEFCDKLDYDHLVVAITEVCNWEIKPKSKQLDSVRRNQGQAILKLLAKDGESQVKIARGWLRVQLVSCEGALVSGFVKISGLG